MVGLDAILVAITRTPTSGVSTRLRKFHLLVPNPEGIADLPAQSQHTGMLIISRATTSDTTKTCHSRAQGTQGLPECFNGQFLLLLVMTLRSRKRANADLPANVALPMFPTNRLRQKCTYGNMAESKMLNGGGGIYPFYLVTL